MTLDVREFAERVLLGSSLEDKLFDPGELRDRAPGLAWRGRAEPGREGVLALSDHAEPFVRDAALADPGSRGRALHFFANHELLALELMALALLRFVDAPPAFRRGLVSTLRDEQRHMRLYLERMRVLGTELGDAPLGGFFWRTVADLDDPAAFVAHMNLTFEQANLDYALHYERVFRALGDETSASLMATVYADEIKHVALGLHWFQRWRPQPPLVEAHADALVAPVSLRRARGRGFDRAGRERAGFSPAYIDALANLPSARGRRPVVHLFDPTMEFELAQPGSFNPNAAMRGRMRDLETLPMWFAQPDDVVLVRRKPRPAFLASVRACGARLPEFVVTDLDAARIDAPGLDAIARVQPWGWTPRLAQRLTRLRARATDDPVPAQGWPAALSSKARGVEVLARLLPGERLSSPDSLGVVAHELDEVDAAIEQFRTAGYTTLVCKAPWGTAGRGSTRVLVGPMPTPQRTWIQRTLARQGALLVEPWLERVCDLSLRLTILAPGRARIDDIGRVLVDARGQYRGAVIGRISAGLPAEVARFMHDEGRDTRWMARVWKQTADEVARVLEPSGYVGTVGVDAIIHRQPGCGDALRLRPVLELNTRVHMGHVTWKLGRLVAKASVGIWRIVPRNAVHEDLPPIEMSARGIRHGVLATNDPEQAEHVVGVLAVAGSVDAAEALLASIGG